MLPIPPAPEHGALAVLADRLARPVARGIDVVTTLAHFALVSYLVPVDRLRPHVDPRFDIVPFAGPGGSCGLLSVVPFLDVDFRFAGIPWLRFRFGQTNYRLYVTHRGEHMAWFFGTALATRWVAVPRHLWRLPWHHARMTWEVDYDPAERRYRRYRLETRGRWAPATLSLDDSGEPVGLLSGFSSPAEQQLVLTHPVRGVFRRRDGRIGSYTVWHPAMEPTRGAVVEARFGLLERLGLLDTRAMREPHSVLLTPRIEFQIALPPGRFAQPAAAR